MEKEKMQATQNQPPVFRQIAGAILGILFAVTGGYSGLEFVFALLFSPIIIAGVVRLVISLYRVFGKLTGQKVYDELGQCIMVLPKPGIASVLAIIGFYCIISVLVSVLQFSTFIGLLCIFALTALEVYVFLKDFRLWKQMRNHT